MKKGPYPRIAQALGVEVGERFVYKDPNKEEVTLYVEENGMVVFIFKDGQKLQDMRVVCFKTEEDGQKNNK